MRLAIPSRSPRSPTASPRRPGKLEFYTARMTEAGLDPLAGYTPPYEAAQRGTPLAARYPLALIAGADHYFLNSMFANVPAQTRRSGAADHPHPPRGRARPAARDRLTRRASFNARGAFVAVGGERPRSGRAWWRAPRGAGRALSKDGATVNATVDERDADMGGGAVFHDNRVIERLRRMLKAS